MPDEASMEPKNGQNAVETETESSFSAPLSEQNVEAAPVTVEPAESETPAAEEAPEVKEEAPEIAEEAPEVKEEAPEVKEEVPEVAEEAESEISSEPEAPAAPEEEPAAPEEAPEVKEEAESEISAEPEAPAAPEEELAAPEEAPEEATEIPKEIPEIPKEMPLAPPTNVTSKDFHELYDETLSFLHGIADKYEFYPEVIAAMRDGDATVELRKRFMLKAIDETWVTVIEDSIQALDEIIRKPGRFIEENEEVLPIELSRHISSRSIRHLAQHTDYISDVDGDKITPSKILNVFYDETMMTYENKFINTLINRLYGFVSRRYTTALEQGKDEKTTSLDVNQTFSHGEVTGKIKFHMEVSEEPKEGDVVKNYTYTTDLWQRVIRLNNITRAYVNSEFAKSMGKTFIRPPVMRTNPILKNRNLRQCLALWEFIESYERTGLELLVHEDLETLDARYVEELYANSALQYSIFRYQVRNAFEPDKTLAEGDSDAPLTPLIQDELVPTESSEFDRTFETEIPLATELLTKRLTAYDWDLLEALEISLEAVGFPPHPLNRDQDPEPDLEDFREKPEDVTTPEPEPEAAPEPVEIIKEVPVEVIKEVPVEVIKEIRVPQKVEQQSVRLSADQWKDLMIGNLLHAGIFASIATIAAAVAVGGLDEDTGKAMLLTEARKAIKPAPELPRVIPKAILPVPDMDLYPLYYIKIKAKQMLDSAALFGTAALHSTKKKAEQEKPTQKEPVKAAPRKAEQPAVQKPIVHREPLKNPGVELKNQILDASRESLHKCGGFLRKKASDVAKTAVFGMILFDKLTAPKSQKPKKKR